MATNSQTLRLVYQAVDQASATVKGITGAVERNRESLRKAGIAMTAAGAAITGAFGLSIRAAQEQQRAMSTLGAVVRGAGDDFEALRPTIEATTAALQRKTNFGDEEQLRVLSQMIPILGNTEQAMQALPAILDAASASGRDASSMARTLTRALAGQANTAESLGLQFDEAAGFGERLQTVMQAVGGAAEANVDPIKQLGNDIGDLQEAIGGALLGDVENFAATARDLVRNIQTWIKQNQGLATVLVRVAAGVGAALAVLGPLLVILPSLVAGIKLVAGAIALIISPWALVVAAIGGVIAAFFIFRDKIPEVMAFVGRQLDTFKDNYIRFWVKPITDGIATIVGVFNDDLAQGIRDAVQKIADVNLESTLEGWGETAKNAGDAVVGKINEIKDSITGMGEAADDASPKVDPGFTQSIQRAGEAARQTTTDVNRFSEALGTTIFFGKGGARIFDTLTGKSRILTTEMVLADKGITGLANAHETAQPVLDSFAKLLSDLGEEGILSAYERGLISAREAALLLHDETDRTNEKIKAQKDVLDDANDALERYTEALERTRDRSFTFPGGAAGILPPGTRPGIPTYNPQTGIVTHPDGSKEFVGKGKTDSGGNGGNGGSVVNVNVVGGRLDEVGNADDMVAASNKRNAQRGAEADPPPGIGPG